MLKCVLRTDPHSLVSFTIFGNGFYSNAIGDWYLAAFFVIANSLEYILLCRLSLFCSEGEVNGRSLNFEWVYCVVFVCMSNKKEVWTCKWTCVCVCIWFDCVVTVNCKICIYCVCVGFFHETTIFETVEKERWMNVASYKCEKEWREWALFSRHKAIQCSLTTQRCMCCVCVMSKMWQLTIQKIHETSLN